MQPIEFTYENDEGDEVTIQLPSKFEVCDRCEGHGTHLNPSIGEHAYTGDEFFEAFSEPEDREAYFRRGGKYDVTCEICKGKRVIPEVDEKACTTPLLKAALFFYNKKLEDDAEYERECAYERRMGY